MQKLSFSIEINAPAEKVWNILWEDATFTDWTSVFAEGSYAVSDWKEGSKIQFIDPNENAGMSSVIEKLVPNQFMSFRHITEIKDGQEQPPKEWSGAHENYTLEENEGITKLTVDLDTIDEYKEMFEDKFPKALERVKALSEI
ncbi:SRPBCC domain-containing protein [Candidatus Daviesbacteria bacterium]|nr:SRPBCC domain-containing protein [Candidatus Daviesbacteria bacterium]